MASQQETIKKVVKEGLEARNLLNFISDGLVEEMNATLKKPPVSPRPQSISPKPGSVDPQKKLPDGRIFLRNGGKRRGSLSRPKSRIRSASAGRNPEKDLRARYWTFLFENLHRAVDEIYQTCEMDESIVESKEAIMMLENYARDFDALIQYININKNYEKTAPINRPTSLAWEVRKSSPGKSLLKNVFIEKLTAGNSSVKRVLCFDATNEEGKKPTADSASEQNISAISDDDRNSFKSCTLQNSQILKSPCDLAIPAIAVPVEEVSHCNEKLIVRKVQCQQNNDLAPKPSVIIEAENENQSTTASSTSLNSEVSNDKTENPAEAESKVSITENEKVDDSLEFQSISKNEDSSVSPNSSSLETSMSTSLISESSIQQISPDIAKAPAVSSPHELITDKPSDGEKTSEVNVISNGDLPGTSQKKVNPKRRTTVNKMSASAVGAKTTRPTSSDGKPQSRALSSASNASSKPQNLKVSKDKGVNCDLGDKTLALKDSKDNQSPTNTAVKSTNLKDSKDVNVPSNAKAPIPRDLKLNPRSTDSNMKNSLSKDPKENPHSVSTVRSASKSKTFTLNPNAKSFKPSLKDSTINLSKPTATTPVVEPQLNKSGVARKLSENAPKVEEKKVVKPTYESAIKRNISYVQSLSSRNHLEKTNQKADTSTNNSLKTNSGTRKMPNRGLTKSSRLSEKSGSMSSLHKPVYNQSWARKTYSVEKIPEILKSTDEDSDGWETVRGRNRCRNSPAKTIPFKNKNQECQALQIAKLNQSGIGGFRYTTKVNGKIVSKNSKSNESISKKHSKQNGKSNNADSKEELNNSESNILKLGKITDSIDTKGDNNVKSKDVTKVNQQSKNSNEFYEIKYKTPKNKELMTLPLDVLSALEGNRKLLAEGNRKHSIRSSSAPCVTSPRKSPSYGLSKTLCISDQSLGSQKYVNINTFKKKLSEKGIGGAKRRVKKAVNDHYDERGTMSGSMDESDYGVTSDDQDGAEQDLYDTAWKYKILEQQVHKLELSWGEQMDVYDMELRTPGRALEMHEKLSSPFRKKSLYESIRECNEKQLKAQEQREKVLEEKAQKFKIIQKKRLEMKTLLEQRQEKQRIIMEQKLQRAEEKRKRQLQMIIRKAHDEEEKVNEIAFINTLEAQNKRHDLISKEKDHEARLQDIQEERQRRQEEKAAKEAAAEGRRKILEAERQARLTEMQEKRKIRDHKVEQLFLVKEKERQELASQKARDRELRLSALNAQQLITIEELQKKIQLKQEESARRHEENMEQIRQKAFELSIQKYSSNNDDVPQPVPYETKKICSICNVLIGSEVYLLSHLHGKKHQEAVKAQYQDKDPSSEELELYNLKHIVNASTDQLDPNIALDKERQKALKKRCKKLRQRMSNRGNEYESQVMKASETTNTNKNTKMDKVLSELQKLSTAVEECSSDSNILPALERHLNEIFSIYQKKLHQDKSAFLAVGGIAALVNAFGIMARFSYENNTFMYKKILNHLSNITESVVENSYEICKFILYSNKIGNLLDLLVQRLSHIIPDNISQLMINQVKTNGINVPLDLSAGKLMHLLTGILTILSSKPKSLNKNKQNDKDLKSEDLNLRVQDLISYIVSIGIVDKLSQFFNCIQGPISNEDEAVPFLLDCMSFLTHLIELNSDCCNSSSNRKLEDTTQLIATLRVTNMVGTVSLLYGLLLHSGAASRTEGPPPVLSKQIELLAFSTLCMLNQMAVMSLQAFQSTLGSEGLSLQLRHITSHLLWYCSHVTSDHLLHEVILLVGYFTVLNPENQSVIQAGQRPTVLQQLCCLPFLYFSDLELTDILFPTLIACCYNNLENKTILQQEMTSELLSNYIEVKYLNIEDSSLKDSRSSIHNKRCQKVSRAKYVESSSLSYSRHPNVNIYYIGAKIYNSILNAFYFYIENNCA
ncbi:hypothetical protein JTE90_005872 [Oedothorax gibbosus]|uniref:U1-type domain-containing protein n=1 Tax=Oedothorax gibbosus TaxID=931172 RepID=A0AAV6UQA8_9ARAC|nr:hypothetical protein JTE90_005872 [Oedothorax gibbosus]